MRVYIASDHAGFELKKTLIDFLETSGYNVVDLGPEKVDPEDDFPDYSVAVARKVAGSNDFGVLVCGTGQGTALAANKIKGIRAYTAWNEFTAKHARENGDANIIAIGQRVTDEETAKNIVEAFLKTPFSGNEKYIRRIKKVNDLEQLWQK